MKSWIHRFALLSASFVVTTPTLAQNQDESRLEPLDVRSECPDTPILPDITNSDGEIEGYVPTRASEQVYGEMVAQLAEECRKQLLVEETRLIAEQIETLYDLATGPEPFGQPELAQHSSDLLARTERLSDLVNYGTDPPVINVAPLPNEDLQVRVQRLVSLSRRLIPNLLTSAGEDAYNLDLLNQVRDDFAIAEALSSVLPESEC